MIRLILVLSMIAGLCFVAYGSGGMMPIGWVTVAPSAPAGETVETTWSMGESVVYYNTTSGIDATWSLGESLILDVKE